MFSVKKTLEISASHCLNLPYDSKCNRPHGHNYWITVELESEKLDSFSMVMDFSLISEIVKEWDHRDLNQEFKKAGLPFRPTAEAMAFVIGRKLTSALGSFDAKIISVTVQESEGNEARWVR